MKKIISWISEYPFISFVLLNLAPIIAIILVSNLLTVFLGKLALFALTMEGLFSIMILLPLILGLGICYWLFKFTRSYFVRGVILYIFWIAVINMLAFFVDIWIGVCELAVMDVGRDLVSYHEPLLSYKTIITGSIFSVPWILICLILIQRFIPIKHGKPYLHK